MLRHTAYAGFFRIPQNADTISQPVRACIKRRPYEASLLHFLLAGDMGYISMVGHGQSQPIFDSFQTNSIQL